MNNNVHVTYVRSTNSIKLVQGLSNVLLMTTWKDVHAHNQRTMLKYN